LVLDHEHEQRLRKEARLEDAAAVLVSHAPLAAVADRLQHGDADVTGCVLDGVDHRLYPLADHHRLHLRPAHSSLLSISPVLPQARSSCALRSRVPTTRKPHRRCSSILATFSGKIDVWIVQIPAASASVQSRPRSAFPTPCPLALSAT